MFSRNGQHLQKLAHLKLKTPPDNLLATNKFRTIDKSNSANAFGTEQGVLANVVTISVAEQSSKLRAAGTLTWRDNDPQLA